MSESETDSVMTTNAGCSICKKLDCCCVCGHQGLCPEDGPTAGLSKPPDQPEETSADERVWCFFESGEYVVDKPDTMGLKKFVEKSAYDDKLAVISELKDLLNDFCVLAANHNDSEFYSLLERTRLKTQETLARLEGK